MNDTIILEMLDNLIEEEKINILEKENEIDEMMCIDRWFVSSILYL